MFGANSKFYVRALIGELQDACKVTDRLSLKFDKKKKVEEETHKPEIIINNKYSHRLRLRKGTDFCFVYELIRQCFHYAAAVRVSVGVSVSVSVNISQTNEYA